MYKQVNVVILPTEKNNSNIQKFGNQLRQSQFKAPNLAYWMSIYFTSGDEIKKGDWCLKWGGGKWIVTYMDSFQFKLHNELWNETICKKIIACTDQALNLPQPPKELVKYFVEQYNKGNIISSVEVEYDVTYISGAYDIEDMFEFGGYNIVKLKINPDNTINIKSYKDSYTRKELIDLASEFDFDGDKKQFYGTSFINKLFSSIGYELQEDCKIENL